jgi:hypothetical protein
MLGLEFSLMEGGCQYNNTSEKVKNSNLTIYVVYDKDNYLEQNFVQVFLQNERKPREKRDPFIFSWRCKDMGVIMAVKPMPN